MMIRLHSFVFQSAMSATISHRRASSVRLNLPPPAELKHLASKSMSSKGTTNAAINSLDVRPSPSFIPAPEKSRGYSSAHPLPPLKGAVHSRCSSADLATSSATPPLLGSFLASIPRKTLRIRNVVLALLAVAVVSIYLLFTSSPPLISYSSADPVLPSSNGPSITTPQSRLFRISREREKSQRPQVQLTPVQELAAVVALLASLPQNVIPNNIDPSRSIDPQLVLDFDTRSDRAATEINELASEVWIQNPVVLFTKVWIFLFLVPPPAPRFSAITLKALYSLCVSAGSTATFARCEKCR